MPQPRHGHQLGAPAPRRAMHDVDITETRAVVDGLAVIRRTYSTPVGSVYEDEWREPGTGQWHGNRSWKDVTPWLTSRLIKGPDDYKVVKYMVEHTEYAADYFPIEQAHGLARRRGHRRRDAAALADADADDRLDRQRRGPLLLPHGRLPRPRSTTSTRRSRARASLCTRSPPNRPRRSRSGATTSTVSSSRPRSSSATSCPSTRSSRPT